MEAIRDTHECPYCNGQGNKVSAGYQEQDCTEYQCTECGNHFKVKEGER